MDITLTPDETLPENTLHVAENLDEELLAVMQQSNFDIVIDNRHDKSRVRISPALCAQIMQWMTFCRVSRNHD